VLSSHCTRVLFPLPYFNFTVNLSFFVSVFSDFVPEADANAGLLIPLRELKNELCWGSLFVGLAPASGLLGTALASDVAGCFFAAGSTGGGSFLGFSGGLGLDTLRLSLRSDFVLFGDDVWLEERFLLSEEDEAVELDF
jgi:hypothetical protein